MDVPLNNGRVTAVAHRASGAETEDVTSPSRRTVLVLVMAPLYAIGAGLAGVGGGILGWRVMPRLGDNLAQPVIDLAFPIVGFLAGCGVGLAVLVLLMLPVARRLRTRQADDV